MLSRREFLHALLVAASGTALSACAPRDVSPVTTPTLVAAPTSIPTTAVPPTAVPTSTPPPPAVRELSPTSLPTATAIPTMTATPIPPSALDPYLTVARGKSPAAITRAAIDALGGISKFVKPGNEVILKPNICNDSYGPEYATTTNPEVLAELVKMCLGAGAKRVRVMDQGFSGTAVEAYKKSGIRAAVERAGGQMEIMSAMKYTDVRFPAARSLKTWKVYQDILKADVVINVPIAKTHDLAKVTLAMKGLMGVITDRPDFHSALDQRIADLNTVIKPTLNIIDAVRTLAVNGPTGGSLDFVVMTNLVIASHDPVAADAYATKLLFLKDPEEIGHIKIGAQMGIGRYDFDKMRIKEVTV